MRRLVAAAACLAVVVAVAPAAAKPVRSWAEPEIKLLVSKGVAPSVAAYRADDPLTLSDLDSLLAAVTVTVPVPRANPTAPVTMSGLNARFVRAAGLADAAAAFTATARSAGLTVPGRFGNEVVARMLGFRKNHPAAQDTLERLPADPASRAEGAFSAARLLRLTAWDTDRARSAATQFVVPVLTQWQRRVLTTALSFVGYPYVWSGESELQNGPFGAQPQGGFDCSGYVWRVYKLQAYPGAAALAEALRGRSSYEMSGEVPRTRRIPFAKLAPGDVLFFGSKGPRSKPAEVDHMGIYVAPGWMVHSSRYGTTLTPLEGYYRERFAWARRPLAEAGLV